MEVTLLLHQVTRFLCLIGGSYDRYGFVDAIPQGIRRVSTMNVKSRAGVRRNVWICILWSTMQFQCCILVNESWKHVRAFAKKTPNPICFWSWTLFFPPFYILHLFATSRWSLQVTTPFHKGIPDHWAPNGDGCFNGWLLATGDRIESRSEVTKVSPFACLSFRSIMSREPQSILLEKVVEYPPKN